MQPDSSLTSVFALIGALTVGVLAGILIVIILYYRQRKYRRQAASERPESENLDSLERPIVELFGWPQAKAAWGSVGAMLFCLVAGLVAAGIRAYDGGTVFFSTLCRLRSERGRSRIVRISFLPRESGDVCRSGRRGLREFQR